MITCPIKCGMKLLIHKLQCCTVGNWDWTRNLIPHAIMDVITYPRCESHVIQSETMLVKRASVLWITFNNMEFIFLREQYFDIPWGNSLPGSCPCYKRKYQIKSFNSLSDSICNISVLTQNVPKIYICNIYISSEDALMNVFMLVQCCLAHWDRVTYMYICVRKLCQRWFK